MRLRRDLERGRLSWFIWMGAEWTHRCLCKMEAEGEFTTEKKAMWRPREGAMLLALKVEEGV